MKKIGEYYYMVSAQGGTAGPPQSHMVITARSKSLDGPWENDPANPLVHTYANSEKWWAKGHGSLIDTADGKWWIVYHAYENGYIGSGRQTLLEPVEITEDGWLKAPTGAAVGMPMEEPFPNRATGASTRLNEFRIGLDWKYYKRFDPARATVTRSGSLSASDTSTSSASRSELTLAACGNSPHESAPLLFVSGEHDYEISACIEVEPATVAGLILFYNADFYVGTGFDLTTRYRWRKGTVRGTWTNADGNRRWLRLRNVGHIITGYSSVNGTDWEKEIWGMDISGYHHNTLYDFVSVLPGLFAFGEGKAKFSEFTYRVIH